jgi:dipeptidyl aminopeptidase/acylaminoacyl peptidase
MTSRRRPLPSFSQAGRRAPAADGPRAIWRASRNWLPNQRNAAPADGYCRPRPEGSPARPSKRLPNTSPPILTHLARWGILALTLAGCPAQSPAGKAAGAAPPAGRIYSVEQFIDTTTYLGNSFSPDNSTILVSSDRDGVFNAYAIRVDDGKATQLTDSKTDAIRVQGYFPADERFLYAADGQGDELDHLYVRELDGRSTDLTPGDGHRAIFLGWARDGDSLFLGTNERDEHYFDAYEVTFNGYRRTLLYRDETGYELLGISPDKRYVALGKVISRDDTDIYIHDRRTATTRRLTPDAGPIEHKFQAFGPDGVNLFYTSNEGSEFAYLVRRNLETGASRVVLRPAWDVSFATISHGGKYLVVGVNEDSRTRIRILDGATLSPVASPAMPEGNVTSVSLSRDERWMSFYAGTSQTPSNLYVHRIDSNLTERLTRALSPEIDQKDLVRGRVVRFESYDGLQIPGLLYIPRGASRDNPVPGLVWVHGGPGGQARDEYNALIQYLVNHQFAVYAINNRGSSGYGKTFFQADDRRHGRADLDDCVASKRMLAETGLIDPDRIGIIGNSYGGYITLAALSFRPHAFAVGVDLFGISNWIRTLEMIPSWWEPIRNALFKEIGDPVADREYLTSISPLYHARNIVRPLMVIQGANDPRVVKPESDDIVAAVRGNGLPVEYLVFEDEGHGLRRKENRLLAYESLLRFLRVHLMERNGQPGPRVAGRPLKEG